MRELGIKIVRFSNIDVNENIEEVMESIKRLVT